ncbi:CAP domain-containing protein [Deinococcus cellulosilyticus]|uniref:SCP domain-containing protein n=1 Tax=Deinococcus cellulosilyticus (strain DSM 18568 / NBRC 106333 / KACC 11606 / 5516J-15) TaxID=1223518 RepID=A0A511N7Q1_DEIC1|nr:CAP domain-containing protein [Deinococcus cellulosilyticus]GEM48869.1 hypothetical protein DC3_45040 [Deinococcus cellulosilyticus NBRC 106333 = KACC 11606]
MKFRVLLLLLTSVLTGCINRPATQTPTDSQPQVTPVQTYRTPSEDLLQKLLKATNAARAVARKCGNDFHQAAPPVVLNIRLIAAAQDHAEDMATHDFFDHHGSDRSDVVVRALRYNYNYRMVGENIAAGYPDVQATVDGWLTSPGHCRNLMNPEFREIGFGFTRKSGTEYGSYWVQVLGVQRSRVL